MAVNMNKLTDGNGILFVLKDLLTKINALLDKKVDKVDGKGLSTNDYTTDEKNKLNGIAAGANKYTHPAHTAYKSGLYKLAVDALGHITGADAVTKADITALGIPGQDTNTTYDPATQSANGLMTAADKAKLDSIAEGANKYAHPAHTAYKSGLYKLAVDALGHIIGADAVTKADITALGIPGQDTNTTYKPATQSANGLMTAADKAKLDAFGAASGYATTSYVGQQIAAAGHISKKIVTALPAASDAADNVIYLIKKAGGSGGNLYDEYMLIDGTLELVGDSATKIEVLSNADLEEILAQL